MADAAKAVKVNKPQLRGLLKSQIKFHLGVSVALAIGSGILWKVFVNDDNLKKYTDFYKNYDIEKTFHSMRNKGIFDSCQPDQ